MKSPVSIALIGSLVVTLIFALENPSQAVQSSMDKDCTIEHVAKKFELNVL